MNVKIIQLSAELWQQYRDMRLEALSTDSQAFAPAYQEELQRPQAQWQAFLRNMWFAVIDNQLVGMVGLLREEKRALIVSMWVKPAYRRQGIGRKLIQHVQDLAIKQNINNLYLKVNETQQYAFQLYQSLDFKEVDNLNDQYVMEWHTNEH